MDSRPRSRPQATLSRFASQPSSGGGSPRSAFRRTPVQDILRRAKSSYHSMKQVVLRSHRNGPGSGPRRRGGAAEDPPALARSSHPFRLEAPTRSSTDRCSTGRLRHPPPPSGDPARGGASRAGGEGRAGRYDTAGSARWRRPCAWPSSALATRRRRRSPKAASGWPAGSSSTGSPTPSTTDAEPGRSDPASSRPNRWRCRRGG